MATSRGRLLGGRYRLKEVLGEGAMSTVSRAHDTLLDRPVAVKLLKPAFAGDGEFVERFYGEARAAARLVHHNVVAIFDVLGDRRSHGIVMEFVDGVSLGNILASHGPLDAQTAIRYARSVAQALAAAHAAGVIHGDVKPENVLLGADGSVKVTDFGLGPGTPRYSAPERLRGEPPSVASDLYSLGATLVQMTALPGARLRTVIDGLMQAVPRERFASAEEVDRELAALEESPRRALPFVESPTLLVNASRPAPLPRRAPFVLPKSPWASAERYLAWFAARLRAADRRLVFLGAVLLCLTAAMLIAGARPRVPVADVRTRSLARARTDLQRQGLRPAVISKSDERVPAGRVISQDPRPGTRLHPGETVRLVVSGGLPLVAVPNLSGQPLADANRNVFAAKLRPAYAARFADAPANTVIEEIPAPGTRLREHSAVLLVLSTGPRPQVIYTGGGGDAGD